MAFDQYERRFSGFVGCATWPSTPKNIALFLPSADTQVRQPAATSGKAASSMVLDESVGEPDLDERLSCDTKSLGFLIDLAQEIDREVDIHALDGSSGPRRPGEVQVCRQVGSGIVHRVELGGRDCFSL
jgi:hypothetical protein